MVAKLCTGKKNTYKSKNENQHTNKIRLIYYRLYALVTDYQIPWSQYYLLGLVRFSSPLPPAPASSTVKNKVTGKKAREIDV